MHAIFLVLACLICDGHGYSARNKMDEDGYGPGEHFESMSRWMGHGYSRSKVRQGHVKRGERDGVRNVLNILAALIMTFNYPTTGWRLDSGPSNLAKVKTNGHYAQPRLTLQDFATPPAAVRRPSSVSRAEVSLQLDDRDADEDPLTPVAPAEPDDQLNSVSRMLNLLATEGDDVDEIVDGFLTSVKGPAAASAAQLKAASDALSGGIRTILKKSPLQKPIEHGMQQADNVEESIDSTGSRTSSEHLYVLHGQNILGWSNQLEGVGWEWDQLTAAGSYFKSRGHQVRIFLPYAQGDAAAQLQGFRQLIGEDCIVTVPAGINYETFMMKRVKDYAKGYIRGIVTNSGFRDRRGSDRAFPSWIQESVIKFAFAADRFIPQDVEMEGDAAAGHHTGTLHHDAHSSVQQNAAISDQGVYVLDGNNILLHSNQLEQAMWNWEQLLAAVSYYKSRGHGLIVFLPDMQEYSYAHFRGLRQLFGRDCIVTAPVVTMRDDEFMMNYVKDRAQASFTHIVTNSQFEDRDAGLGVSESWVENMTMKFIFVAGSFIPQYVESEAPLREARMNTAGEQDSNQRRIYLLDGQNILRHSNQLKTWPFWNWDQLIAAGSFYKIREHQVLVFLPEPQVKAARELYAAQLQGLRQTIGTESIVLTPGGCADSAFLVNYVKEHEEEQRSIQIVTNSQFVDSGLSKMWIKEHTVSFAFAAGSFIPGSHKEEKTLEEVSNQRIYVLDGLNILRSHQMGDEAPEDEWKWQQLASVGSYYKSCGHEVLVFLPREDLKRNYAAELQILRQQFGPDSIVMTPAGSTGNAFMINFVKDHPKNRATRIVSNHDFKDDALSFLVSESWVADHTVKFQFTAGSFIPEDAKEIQQEVLKTSIREFGLAHPNTLWAKINLFSTLVQSGDLEAEELRREISEVNVDVFGPQHPSATLMEELQQQIASRDVNVSQLRNQPAMSPLDSPEVKLQALSDAKSLAESVPLETFEDAEARGEQFFQAGEFDRAMRMFEIAQTLPGAGTFVAPADPGELAQTLVKTAQRRLAAQYNIACCCAALGNKVRALELLRNYVDRVSEPLNQIDELLADPDLATLRHELQALRDEYEKPLLSGFMNDAAELLGVDLKEDSQSVDQDDDGGGHDFLVGESVKIIDPRSSRFGTQGVVSGVVEDASGQTCFAVSLPGNVVREYPLQSLEVMTQRRSSATAGGLTHDI